MKGGIFMKLNKMLAFVASLVLLSSCVALPVNAGTGSATFVVVGVEKENPDSYILRIPQGKAEKIHEKMSYDFRISKETISKFNSSIDEVKLGDIITLEGNLCWGLKEFAGMHHFSELLKNGTAVVDESTITATIVGSVFNNPEIMTCTVTGINGLSSGRTGKYSESKPSSYYLIDEDGYNFDFWIDWGITEEEGYTYYQADCIDNASLEVGDTISCITYHEIPMIITEKVSDITVKPVSVVTANGDADGNGTLDILDVITVNKAVLGKENLDPERIPYIDFNQNQVPDSDDALTMLKKIVGLS